jgi:CheY-like chemotaxis protein
MLAVESGRAYRPDEVLRSRLGMELQVGDALLPLRDLGQCLGFRETSAPTRGEPVILCQLGDKRTAFLVDQVVESRDLAVHPLPQEIRDVGAYQGAATLAMGELLLVLHPAWLVAQADTGAKAPSHGGPHALIVDDSLTARAIYRTILESAGYSVHAVATERQALEQVKSSTYDVILVDILLGDTNGIDLVGKLRARADTRAVPIIVISTESAEAEKNRVLAAGANRFLTKAECGSGRLLDEVSWLTSRKERAS